MKDLFTGPTTRPALYGFLTAGIIPHQFMSCADGVKIFQKDYFRPLRIISARSTSSAFAIFRQVIRVGLRLWFSTKLIVARLKPVNSASLSCDTPRSFRTAISSETIFAASFSDSLSLIIKDNQALAPNLIRNYS